jgi:Flp pilus assembly pilin Flp
MMMNKRVLALCVRLRGCLSALDRYAARRGVDPERGASTLEWVIIAAVVFLLAIAAGAKITQVVNDQLDKIG